MTLIPQSRGANRVEELHLGRHALLLGEASGVARRFYTKDGNARSDEMLQKVAVVRRDLDDHARPVERQPLGHGVDVALRVLHPGAREAAEVRVVAIEELVRVGEVLRLDEPALLADEDTQRVPTLRLLKAIL